MAVHLHKVYQLWSQQLALELEQWLQDNCQPIGLVEAHGKEAAEGEETDEIKEDVRQSDRLEEMEAGPSGQSESGSSTDHGKEEISDQTHMEGMANWIYSKGKLR